MLLIVAQYNIIRTRSEDGGGQHLTDLDDGFDEEI